MDCGNDRQRVSFEELLISQVVCQEALIRLLIGKGVAIKEEFLEMVKVVDRERKKTDKNGEIPLPSEMPADKSYGHLRKYT